MRPVAVVAAAVAVSWFACTGGYVARQKAQRKQLRDQLPAVLEVATRREGPARVAVVRVYADASYRAQNLRWQHGFGDVLDYASQLLQPLIGVRLEAEYKSWDRSPPVGGSVEASLEATLVALERLDPGDDVAWVIGLTSALDAVSNDPHTLGIARSLAPHLVLRGYADVHERKQFAKILDVLAAAELEEVHDARRRHKQATILLHEIGHTLGAIHASDPGWVLNPRYSRQATTITDRNRELMEIAVVDRLRPAAERQPLRTALELLAALEHDWGGWVQDDKDELVSFLRNRADAAKAGETAADVPAAVYPQYDRARTLASRGQLDAAAAELDPLIAAYPGNATIRLVACEIELRRPGGATAAKTTAKATCARAIELAAGDPRPHFTIASYYLRAHEVAAARAELVVAEAKIANLPRAEAAWLQLAGIYQGMGALAWAEAAAGKAGQPEHPVLAWAKTTRARYGVPATGPGAIAPEDEAAAVTAVRQILDAVYAGKVANAERAARAAEKRWPKLPGIAAARCDLALRQGQLGAARQRCRAAIAAYPDASWALYLEGILALRGTGPGDTAAGIASLRRAIAVDPELAQAWRALAKALHRARDADGVAELEADYRARFGQSLGR